jgi:hypothetical protein
MAKGRGHRPGKPDGDGGEHRHYGPEPYDDPEEHREIERLRFRGSLPATPERYALAREQWYQLPGALVRPPMDPPVGQTGAGERQPEQGNSDVNWLEP